MKLKTFRTFLFLLTCLWCSSVSIAGKSDDYVKLWKKVSTYELADQPQSVIGTCNEIYARAKVDNNNPQMLKAFLKRMDYRQRIEEDSTVVDIHQMEQWQQNELQPVFKSILGYFLAKSYMDHQSLFPEIKEDSMIRKSLRLIRSSTVNQRELAGESTKTWDDIIVQGRKSNYFAHDMYHLLVHSGVDLFDSYNKSYVRKGIKRMFHEALLFYRSANNRDGVLLLTLDSLNYARYKGLNNEAYIACLKTLRNDYSDTPVCAQVYMELANLARQKEHYQEDVDLLNEAIKRYSKYENIGQLQNLLNQLKQPEENVKIQQRIYPGDSLKLNVTYRNINSLDVSIYKSKTTETLYDKKEELQLSDLRKVATRVKDYSFKWNERQDYATKDTVLIIPTSEVGNYYLVVKNSVVPFTVTRLYLLHRLLPDNLKEVVILDSKSGKPVERVDVTCWKSGTDNKNEQIANMTTDKTGTCIFKNIPKDLLVTLTASKGKDLLPSESMYSYSSFYQNNDNKETVSFKLFTDRAVYRPGQIVYVKGIAYLQNGDDVSVCANKEYNVELYDANRKKIADSKVKTNDFGSFTTPFTLPSVTLNGSFSVAVNDSRVYILVEEYKRPTFEVKIDRVKTEYKLGDTLHLNGTVMTYNGLPLLGRKVRYTVTRSSRQYYWNYNASDQQLKEDSVAVRKDGTFDMPVELIPDSLYDYYMYKVKAFVTDVTGETREAQYELTASKIPVLLSTNLQPEMNVDNQIRGKFIANNAEGVDVSDPISAWLSRDGKEVWRNDHIASNKYISLIEWKSLTPGKYLLQWRDSIIGKDMKKEIVLFSEHSSVMPVDTVTWEKQLDDTFSRNGAPASILFGTSHPDTYVMYSVYSEGKIIENKRFTLSNELKRFDFTYDEKYGNGIFVQICFVINGTTYQRGFTITKPWPEKSLTLKWARFRNSLQPGNKETWSLTIKNKDNKAAEAEMMATLYDASLDAFKGYFPNIRLNYPRFVASDMWGGTYDRSSNIRLQFPLKYNRTDDYVYDYFENSLGIPVIGYGVRTRRNVFSMVSDGGKIAIRGTRSNDAVLNENVLMKVVSVVVPDGSDTNKGEKSNSVKTLRTDFNETAFFYPQLRTDDNGDITFSFTAPESLTRWNFIGLAHTKDMQTGMLASSAMTTKDFMIMPNLPRFARVGDNVSIVARINNKGIGDVKGTARLQLFDPATDKIISTIQLPFFVAKEGETSVTFKFIPTEEYPLLGVRIIAEGGNFSDGEQHLLPVLSNKEYLTETVPFMVRGKQTKEYSLNSLFNSHSSTATNRRMIVECTGSPAWYAIQALPTLSQPTNEDALSWATAWYANSIAGYIANSQPRIKKIFDMWRAQGVDKNTLWSKLQKNEDVKNILLNESPWVAEANNQMEQQQRVATLFDVNNMQYQLTAAGNKLEQMQQPDGGWSWYPGMPSSPYITSYILKLMARYNALSGKEDTTLQNVQKKGMSYLHKVIAGDYNRIINHKMKPYLGNAEVEYLYICSLTGNQIPVEARKAYDCYMQLSEKDMNQLTIFGKAVMSNVFLSAHNTKAAASMLESIRQYAVHTPDGGAFYNPSADGFSWWGNPLLTQSAAIEAFSHEGKNSAFVDDLKIGLLKKKQAESWGSSVSTADAIYALLYNNADVLESKDECQLTLKGVGVNKSVEAVNKEAGTEYFRTEITDETLRNNAEILNVKNSNSHIAWGAVYGSAMEWTDKIGTSCNALSVKKVYLRNDIPVTALRVGDRVTSRLTIKLDRDMDFVQVNDERPACMEPGVAISGYHWNGRVGYYVAVKDASTRFFFDHLPKGTYVLEYTYSVDRLGIYQSGIATIQSAYAPEFAAHSSSNKITVE